MPKSLDDAVTMVMQTEAHFTTSRIASTISHETANTAPVAAATMREEKLLKAVETLAERLGMKLNYPTTKPQYKRNRPQRPPPGWDPNSIICFNCGHLARGCLVPRRQQGNNGRTDDRPNKDGSLD